MCLWAKILPLQDDKQVLYGLAPTYFSRCLNFHSCRDAKSLCESSNFLPRSFTPLSPHWASMRLGVFCLCSSSDKCLLTFYSSAKITSQERLTTPFFVPPTDPVPLLPATALYYTVSEELYGRVIQIQDTAHFKRTISEVFAYSYEAVTSIKTMNIAHQLQKFFMPFCHLSLSPPPCLSPSRGNTVLLLDTKFISIFNNFKYMELYSMYSFGGDGGGLVSFTQPNYPELRPCCRMNQHFIYLLFLSRFSTGWAMLLYNEFAFSPADEHLNCFNFLAITKSTTMNIHM